MKATKKSVATNRPSNKKKPTVKGHTKKPVKKPKLVVKKPKQPAVKKPTTKRRCYTS